MYHHCLKVLVDSNVSTQIIQLTQKIESEKEHRFTSVFLLVEFVLHLFDCSIEEERNQVFVCPLGAFSF